MINTVKIYHTTNAIEKVKTAMKAPQPKLIISIKDLQFPI